MKRIIIFSYDFPPNTGGISRLTEKIAWFLAERYGEQHIIEVLTLFNSSREFYHPNVKIITVTPTLSGRTIEAYNYLSEIKDKENTIVICGLWWPEGVVTEIAGLKNTYILTHAAEIRPDNTWFRKKIWIPIVASSVLRRAKKIVANSEFTAKLSTTLSPKARVECLPLAVDHNIFKPEYRIKNNSDIFKLLTVTRIQLWKGLDTILEALCNLPDTIRNKIVWEIAGKGPDTDLFLNMVKKTPISDQVRMLGFVSDDDLPMLYANADLFLLCTREDVNSSNIEGFGLVFLESQASGTPVIGTPFGGIPSAIENNNGGWMIKDSHELTSLLESLLTDPSELHHQGIMARKRVEDAYTWKHYINSLSNIIGLE